MKLEMIILNNKEMAKQLFMFVGLMQREPIKKMQKISQGEMAMLGFLTYEKSETNPKELSERFNLSTARVANTLNSLERKEYIKRVHDSFDRRKVMVYITEKGKEVFTETEKEALNEFSKLLSYLGENVNYANILFVGKYLTHLSITNSKYH